MSAPANTFGAITHEGGRWRIECEPHVRTKLRRLFPQVDQRASEVVWLSDSAENSRDLLWFIDRYPMSVSPLKLLNGLSADHVEAESLVHQLQCHVRAPDPFELAMPPRDYQAEAASLSLRAGAGTDGLQHLCKVGVFAELDWFPGVHVQCIGRFHRDEQDEPSIAYFLLAEDGSDPVMADIVGLKKTQLEGVRDPDAELLEELEIDAGGVKRMAESYLAKLGQGAPARGAQGAQEDEIEEAFA